MFSGQHYLLAFSIYSKKKKTWEGSYEKITNKRNERENSSKKLPATDINYQIR